MSDLGRDARLDLAFKGTVLMHRAIGVLLVIAALTASATASAGGNGGVGGVGGATSTGGFGGSVGIGGEGAAAGFGGGAPVDDQDADGYTVAEGDCDDTDPLTFPGAPEQADGVDNNCNGEVDEYGTNAQDSGAAPWANILSIVLLSTWIGIGTWRRRRREE